MDRIAIAKAKEVELRNRIRPFISRQHGSRLLLVIGLILCSYVGGSYLWMYGQQRKLLHEWQAQNQNRPSSTVAANSPENGLTRLVIPKIDLDAIVTEGTSHRSLLLGPGHLKNTALPGAPGNAVIAAHRDTFFRHVYELKAGDDIYIERSGKKYHYVVSRKRIVLPTDLSVLEPTSDAQLTLITCYPIYYVGPAPKRLVIFATLVQQA